MINQERAQVSRPIRYPLEPITITNSHALMAIAVGAMMSEMLPEHYLLHLIDEHAQELHDELGREMIAPWRELSPEEYAAYCARHP